MFSSLTSIVENVLREKFNYRDAQISWERSSSQEHGDIASPIALQIAKRLQKHPREIAEILAEALQGSNDVEKVEVAGAGYVNVWLSTHAIVHALSSPYAACTAKVRRENDSPVIVEYSQPNIAKPLGVHHLLSTLIGQSIANLYEHEGYNTVKWNYLGDWGTQFGKLAVAVERFGDGRPADEYSIDDLLRLYVQFHHEAETDASLEDAGREAFRKLEEGDSSLAAFRDTIVSTTKGTLSALYNRMHVSFDVDLGEAFYQGKMEPILKEGIEKHVFVEGEGGALIVQFTEEEHMPPYMVRKGDGATLYSTRDIAQMRYRIDTYHPQEILIVTDIAQKLHFEQLIATCAKLQWEIPLFTNVLVGRMRFSDKAMSTRKGNVLKLEQVLDEAVDRATKKIEEHGDSIQADNTQELAEMMGVGAVAYSILGQNRKADMVFDWNKALSFEGNSAPYLQYTHARARSVVEKAGGKTALPESLETIAGKERKLCNTLLQFEHALQEARASHMPHVLAHFLFDLCQDFNAFYNEEPILKAEEPVRSFRLYLTNLTASVLKTGANILTISVPDRM